MINILFKQSTYKPTTQIVNKIVKHIMHETNILQENTDTRDQKARLEVF